MPRSREREPRGHWLTHGAFCAAASWGAAKLWPIGQSGNDLACAAACCLGLVAAKKFLATLSAWDYGVEMGRLRYLSRVRSDVHGKAEWGTQEQARKAGMFKGDGVFIGRSWGKDLYYPGEAHLMTIAPAGAGKGTSIVVPNLLTYRGSMVVTDPKGELCAMTARHRRDVLGQRVVVLNPWREKLSRELELDLGDDGYNPLGLLKAGPDVKDDASLIASLLVPGRAQMSESEAFFVSSGRAILAAAMLHLISEKEGGEPVTLPELRSHLMADPEQLEAFLAQIAANPEFGGVIAEDGKRFVGEMADSPKQFMACLATATEALKVYDSFGPLGQHVSRGTFSFEECKREPTTVYLIMPSDRAGTHAAWLNLTIGAALEQVGRDRSNKRVLFLLDEFANLGFMPGVLRAMAQYRGQGVQVHTIWQQISQAQRIYKDGWREIVGLSELVNIFGVWEPETLELVSKWVGNKTVRDLAYTSAADARFDGGQDVSLASSDRSRPLIRPEEVRTLSRGEQLVLYRNLPPLKAELVSYLERRAWRKAADPNPYHRQRAHGAA